MEAFHDRSMKPHEGDETVEQSAPLHYIELYATGLFDAFVKHLGKDECVGNIVIIGMYRIVVDKLTFHHVKTKTFSMIGLGIKT